jgi:kynurenine formamidase
MKIFDLTMEIDDRTPTFPDDPTPEIIQIGTIKQDGVNKKK